MLLAASEWTNQALPPFNAGMGPTLLLAAAGLLTAITLATYLLRRTLSVSRTMFLLGLRLFALLLIFLSIWRPTRASYDDDAIATSDLYLLLDVSESMAVADEGPGLSRFQRGKDLLDSDAVVEMLQRLSREQKIETRLFQGAIEVKPLDASAAPLGKRTEMGRWLFDLRETKRGSNPLRGVIVLSDGIDNGKTLTTAEAGKYRGVAPLYMLGLGKSTTTLFRRDIALTDIQVEPERVPVKGKMTVKGTIDALGFTNPTVDVVLNVEDRKTNTMKPLATLKNVPLRKSKGNEVVLQCDAPMLPGEVKVQLKVSPVDGEVNTANNEIVTYVPIDKGGVTILWVEGTPRHESAFAIRTALAKDKRFNVFYALKPLGAKEDPADFFDFAKRHYDVIVIGDISAKRFSGDNPDLLKKINEMVKRGTGLLMLGGFESLGESDWQGTPIASLLPVDLEKGQHQGQVKVEPDKLGLEFLLRLVDNPVDNKKLWDVDLAPLEGANRVGKLRVGATVVAWGVTSENERFPILANTTVGDGRVLTFAGDTTHQAWIRPATTEGPSTVKEYQRFWKQMMLWLAHQEESESNLRVKLDRQRVDAGVEDRLGFDVEFRGSTGLPIESPEFTAKLVTPSKEEFDAPISRENLKGGGVQFRGLLANIKEPGEYTLKVTAKGKEGKDMTDKSATARFMAYAEDLESTRVAADPKFLEDIADKGGGEYFPADETKLLHILEKIAADRKPSNRPRVEFWPPWQRQPASDSFGDQWEALWSTPTFLIMLLFVGAITTEWVLRRKWGLV